MKNDLVSILVANYNNQDLLVRAITSCENQNVQNIEILVHDDNSTDNSLEILKRTKNIKLISNQIKTNEPYLDAMNAYERLFNISSGKYIFFLDSDDYFTDHKIKKICNIYSKNKEVKFVQNYPEVIKGNNKYLKLKNNLKISRWPFFAPTSCLSTERNSLKEFFEFNSGLKSKFYDVWLDFRLCAFFYFKKKNFYNCKDFLTYYEQSFSQNISNEYKIKKWFSRREQSHKFVNFLMKEKQKYFYHLDYMLTIFSSKILQKIKWL